MKFSKRLWFGALAVLLSGAMNSAVAQGRQVLRKHVPEIVSRLNANGKLPNAMHLNLAIGLPLRNEHQLDELLRQISDPSSPNYRHYLTPKEFAEQFGPSEKNYRLVAAFFQANGFKVTEKHLNRVVLDVDGSVADIERVFHVTLQTYRHPTEARNFFAPNREASLDLQIPLLHVSGLDNYSLPQPMIVREQVHDISPNAVPQFGAGTNNSYMANDLRAAYLADVNLTGSGQKVALLQFDGYVSNDIAAYISLCGLTNYPISLTNIAVNGGVSVPTAHNLEVALDIEMVIAIAPGVSKIIVYEAPNPTAWSTILSRIANDNLAQQIGCSWANNLPSGPDATSEVIFKQMAAQGQSFFAASGDKDAYTSGIPFPSESTNITQVGGTTLKTMEPGGDYVSETVWNNGGGGGSGGGVSANYALPVWQQGINMTTNKGSTTMRNVPDVAFIADNVFVIADTNKMEVVGGTSVAAPMWAAFTALINQQAALSEKPAVGFINPAVYAIGKSVNYASDFRDITTGNNFWSSSPTKFPAATGYDLCTGWGTPNGMNTITALATPDTLGILPGAGFTANGVTGGPFDVTSQNFALTNSGGSSLDWAAVTPLWLTVSPTNGTLPAASSTVVTVSLNSAATDFLAGVYITNVIFTNLTTHIAQSRRFRLKSGQSPVQNRGFESGDLTDWTFVGDTIVIIDGEAVLYDGVVNAGYFGSPPDFGTNFVHSGTYGMAMGDTTLARLSQTIPTLPGQSYLISFWMNNVSNGIPNQFQVNWNTNTSATNTIFNQFNIPVIKIWTNMLFVVTATGTNTTLQLAAENDGFYFGLDDISVVPVPNPSFRSFTATNNILNLTWNSLTGVQYQLQFSTNLLKTNWVNLGNIITATNNTATTTNSTVPDPVRFYRIKRLP